MNCRKGAQIAVIGGMLLSFSQSNADQSDLDQPKACSQPGMVKRLTCRVHQQAVWAKFILLSTLRAEHRLDSPSISPKSRTVEDRIRETEEVLRAAGVAIPDLRETYEREASISATNAVAALLSSTNYGYEAMDYPLRPLPTGSEDALARNIGICGHQAALLKEVLTDLGLRARSEQFFWRDDQGAAQSHISVGVWWKGKWHLYDPTFDATFAARDSTDDEPIGAEEARQFGFRAVVNVNNDTYRNYLRAGYAPFAHLTRANVDFVASDTGTVNVHFSKTDGYSALLGDIPNFIGRSADSFGRGVIYEMREVPPGAYRIRMDIAAIGGACTRSSLRIGDQSVPLKSGPQTLGRVTAPATMRIEGPEEICYAVMKSLQLQPVGGARLPEPVSSATMAP